MKEDANDPSDNPANQAALIKVPEMQVTISSIFVATALFGVWLTTVLTRFDLGFNILNALPIALILWLRFALIFVAVGALFQNIKLGLKFGTIVFLVVLGLMLLVTLAVGS